MTEVNNLVLSQEIMFVLKLFADIVFLHLSWQDVRVRLHLSLSYAHAHTEHTLDSAWKLPNKYLLFPVCITTTKKGEWTVRFPFVVVAILRQQFYSTFFHTLCTLSCKPGVSTYIHLWTLSFSASQVTCFFNVQSTMTVISGWTVLS